MISKIESEFDEFTSDYHEKHKCVPNLVQIKQFYRGKIEKLLEEYLNKDTVFIGMSSLENIGNGKAGYLFNAERAMEFFDELKETYEDSNINDKINKLNK